MDNKTVTTYYLEMRTPEDLKEKTDPGGLMLSECKVRQFQFNRFLYQFIGGPWQWVDKLSWPDEKWENYVNRDELRTWVAYYKGAVAGYYELEKQKNGDVEISYFGLAPMFIGRGFGGYLLSCAIASAWKRHDTRRVWVHTCTLDHPGALQNYQSRGMTIYKTETEEVLP